MSSRRKDRPPLADVLAFQAGAFSGAGLGLLISQLLDAHLRRSASRRGFRPRYGGGESHAATECSLARGSWLSLVGSCLLVAVFALADQPQLVGLDRFGLMIAGAFIAAAVIATDFVLFRRRQNRNDADQGDRPK